MRFSWVFGISTAVMFLTGSIVVWLANQPELTEHQLELFIIAKELLILSAGATFALTGGKHLENKNP